MKKLWEDINLEKNEGLKSNGYGYTPLMSKVNYFSQQQLEMGMGSKV